MARCEVCFRHCELAEGQSGFCRVRVCEAGIIHPINYGMVTSLAINPIEKKPLARFRPGAKILSVGSWGCNLKCPFCQNHEISWPMMRTDAAEMMSRSSGVLSQGDRPTHEDNAPSQVDRALRENNASSPKNGTPSHGSGRPLPDSGTPSHGSGRPSPNSGMHSHDSGRPSPDSDTPSHDSDKPSQFRRRVSPANLDCRYISPKDLADLADYWQHKGNIGVAFTYNEPLVAWEYVRDAARLVHERGMANVLVTNGTASRPVLEEIAPYIDAMNIDLKGFTDRYYTDVLKGDRRMVMDFIARAVQVCHVELTTLIVPGENDSEDEMRELSRWVSQLTDADGNRVGENVPLHVTRFFPRYRMTDRSTTPVGTVYRLAEAAREALKYVYTGNC